MHSFFVCRCIIGPPVLVDYPLGCASFWVPLLVVFVVAVPSPLDVPRGKSDEIVVAGTSVPFLVVGGRGGFRRWLPTPAGAAETGVSTPGVNEIRDGEEGDDVGEEAA